MTNPAPYQSREEGSYVARLHALAVAFVGRAGRLVLPLRTKVVLHLLPLADVCFGLALGA